MGIPLMVLNQYYAPDIASTGQIAAELCQALSRKGFEIYVITAQPSYTSCYSPKAPYFEIQEGVHIYRVPLWGPKGRERLHVRLSGYFQFLCKGWWLSWRLGRKVLPEYIITFQNPPLIPLLGAWLAKKLHARFIYILFDIHPDVLLATGWNLPQVVTWVWEQFNKWTFKSADVIVVLGEGMKQTLLTKGVPPHKVKVIPLWGRPELSPSPKDQALRYELGIKDEEIMLLYAGNMGIMHPLDPLLDAVKFAEGLPIWFVFVGDGVRLQQLVTRAKREGLRKVIFLPFQTEERFVRFVSAADACFVVLKPGLEKLALPSRTFTFLSAGKPIIAWMSPQAEVARLLRDGGCGWNVTSFEQLIDLLHQLVNDRREIEIKSLIARKVYEDNFSKEKIIATYAELMDFLRGKDSVPVSGS